MFQKDVFIKFVKKVDEMGVDELEVDEMGIKPRSCAQFAPEYKFAPGSKFTPGCKCTPLCRVHMPINCVHTHLNLIRNLIQVTPF